MLASDLAQLDAHPEWRLLLVAYHAQQIVSPDGWVDRITEFPELVDDQLSRAHGRLIALGWLDFDLGGRNGGMRYQINTAGKQALDRRRLPDLEEDDSQAA